ncbi:MAG: M20 family metallopeptidase [Pseudomonadota bacterium]
MKNLIYKEIDTYMDDLVQISKKLYDEPELSGEEYKSSELVAAAISRHGFGVEKGIYNIDTAFRAEYDSKKDGITVAFFCEYDALPGVGHGCGHNLISAISIGAAIGLKSVIDQIGGRILVFGTPAEETSGVKVQLAEYGAFKGVDFAMMVHPNPVTEASGSSLALDALKFQFRGKAAHAAQAPEKGINALDAVLLMYNGINALRQHLPSDVKILGIISHGGEAPNVVPEYAEAKFYIRSAERKYLSTVKEKVLDCARGAALMTGAKLEVSNFENSYDNMKTNRVLSELFNTNLRELGETDINPPGAGIGSIDMGNVSQVVPSIHPWVGIGNAGLVLHTREFAESTVTDKGRALLCKGACAMAATALDVMQSKVLQEKIHKEFMS